jgi:hypothetical protein
MLRLDRGARKIFQAREAAAVKRETKRYSLVPLMGLKVIQWLDLTWDPHDERTRQTSVKTL